MGSSFLLHSDAVGVDREKSSSRTDERVEVEGFPVDAAWIRIFWVDNFDSNWIRSCRACGAESPTTFSNTTGWKCGTDEPGLTDGS